MNRDRVTDATALAAAVAEGRTTAREVMAAAISAAEAHAGLGAVTRLEAKRGLADAGAADDADAGARGPFHGVPFLGKDLGSAARGLPPGAGSNAVRDRSSDPDRDSSLFTRFRAAGLLPFGLTTVPEFGLALSAEPAGAPPARNPFATDRTPGGSSGGAAAAVAAGIVAIAHATDAAGSIRVPAACCGLFGLKPSRGVMPQGPLFTNHLMGIASELVLARSLRDVRTAFLAAGDPVPGPAVADRPRIAYALPERCDPALQAAVRAAGSAFADAGCEIFEIVAPDALGGDCHRVARKVLSVSLASWLDALSIPDAEVPPIIAATAWEGRAVSGIEVFETAREIARLTHEAGQVFDRADAVLMPVLSGPPPLLGHFDPDATDPADRFAGMEAMAPNAALANVAGFPALAFPFGMSGMLPLGLQLIGPMGSDLALFDILARIEGASDPIVYPHPVAGMPE